MAVIKFYRADGTGPYFKDKTNVPAGAQIVSTDQSGDSGYSGSATIDIIGNVISVANAVLDEIDDNTVKRTYPLVDENKLATIDEDAEENPIQVTGGEIAAGTETALRSFSPADVKAMIDAHS